MTDTRIPLFLLVLLLLAGTGVAQPERGMRGDMRRQMKEKLKLSDEQEKALRDIRVETGKKMIDLRAAMQKKRLDLRPMMDDPSASRDAVEAAVKDIAALQAEMKMTMFDADRNVMAKLSPEQQEIWKELRQKRMNGFREKAGRGMRGGYRGGPPEDDPD